MRLSLICTKVGNRWGGEFHDKEKRRPRKSHRGVHRSKLKTLPGCMFTELERSLLTPSGTEATGGVTQKCGGEGTRMGSIGGAT